MKKLWDLNKVLRNLEVEGQMVWHHHGSDIPTSPGAILLHNPLLGCIEIWITLYHRTFFKSFKWRGKNFFLTTHVEKKYFEKIMLQNSCWKIMFWIYLLTILDWISIFLFINEPCKMLQNIYENHGNILGIYNLTFREFVDGMFVQCGKIQ